MAFDFPDNPAVGDEFTGGGATYTFTAQGVWDLGSSAVSTDYVLKAGDTVTGLLTFTDARGVRVVGLQTPTPVGTIELMAGAAAQKGAVGLFAPDGLRHALIGWGSATEVELRCENGARWKMSGQLYMANAGIQWGNNTAVADKFDLSKGICLYGGGSTSQFGFSITSGTLNYVVQTTQNGHKFWCGDKSVFEVYDDTVYVNADFTVNGNFTDNLGVDVFATLKELRASIAELKAEIASLNGAKAVASGHNIATNTAKPPAPTRTPPSPRRRI